MDATKPLSYHIWTYRRNPDDLDKPSLVQTVCSDTIPIVLCSKYLTRSNTIVLSQYMTRLVERHEAEALFPGPNPEPCAGCGAPAVEALHQLILTLNADPDPDPISEKPMASDVSDFMVPICSNDGACEEQALALLDERILDYWLTERQGLEPVKLRRHCQACSKDVDLRRCSRCGLVAYCTRRCQRQDRKWHEPHCRHLVPQSRGPFGPPLVPKPAQSETQSAPPIGVTHTAWSV